MVRLRLTLSVISLALAACLTLSCGVGSPPKHLLESITLSPGMADAQNYANGQVQFTATGTYTTAPTIVTPLSATWGACYQLAPTTAVNVSQSGIAQCTAGASGTFFIWATVPLDLPGAYNCPAENACGGGCVVQATALLTCP